MILNKKADKAGASAQNFEKENEKKVGKRKKK